MDAVELGGEVAREAVLVRYRKREIGARELEFIRGTIASGTFGGRVELSRIICQAWNWRQANGALSECACRDLLLRLEEWGHIKLPAGQRRGRRPGVSQADKPRRRPIPELPLPVELIPIVEIPIGDADADLSTLMVRPIAAEERLGWRVYMERYHYLGERPVVGEHLLYAAFLDADLVALIGWAAASMRAPARERFIGWSELTRRKRLHLVVNNVRFLVLPWVRVHNLASRILALNLRRLSSDWQDRWSHPVHLAETFVDTSRYRGTCYRAANWIYLGQTAGLHKRGNRYRSGATPKALYVYALHRRARRLLSVDD
jgi:hypothetical protein